MSQKRKRQICRFHVIGQYYHSASELYNFCIKADIDGLGTFLGLIYYNYCPMCGEKITEKIKVYQMSIDKEIYEKLEQDTNKCRIPKLRRIKWRKIRRQRDSRV